MTKEKSRACFVYVLCEPNSDVVRYVGVSLNPKKRLYYHKYAAKHGSSYHVSRWLRKIKFKPVQIIIEEFKEQNWRAKEKKWIAFYRAKGARLTNLTNGGEGVIGAKFSEEFKRQCSERFKGNKFSLGIHPNKITRKKISDGVKRWIAKNGSPMRGRKLSKKQCLFLSEINKGNSYALGCKRSKATRLKMSISAKNKTITDKMRAGFKIISEKAKGNKYKLGHKHSDKFKKAVSKRMIGNRYASNQKWGEERRAKHSKMMQGNKFRHLAFLKTTKLKGLK